MSKSQTRWRGPRALLGAALIASFAGVAPAQDDTPSTEAPDEALSATEEGLDLLGQGARRLLEGLNEEIQPLLEQMGPALQELVEQMGPAMNELAEMIGDLNAFYPPEQLPNGDIILRRKPPKTPDLEAEPETEEAPVEL